MLRLTRKFGCNLAIARPIATWIELCAQGGNSAALGQMPARVPGWKDVFPGVPSNKNRRPGQRSTGAFPTFLAGDSTLLLRNAKGSVPLDGWLNQRVWTCNPAGTAMDENTGAFRT
eukprot:10214191-Alexandrium_andersonii.AAC.1